ncbi:hypothetical protein XENOCAPTIV_024918 [Xenoophorus captivus]|uniref:Uncharacterized protein n=1 Tax=Xenoophorus captivus TaxID=1517983 RepID=A0ABV0RUY8_9TELE
MTWENLTSSIQEAVHQFCYTTKHSKTALPCTHRIRRKATTALKIVITKVKFSLFKSSVVREEMGPDQQEITLLNPIGKVGVGKEALFLFHLRFRRSIAASILARKQWTESLPFMDMIRGSREFVCPVHMWFVDLGRAHTCVPQGILGDGAGVVDTWIFFKIYLITS